MERRVPSANARNVRSRLRADRIANRLYVIAVVPARHSSLSVRDRRCGFRTRPPIAGNKSPAASFVPAEVEDFPMPANYEPAADLDEPGVDDQRHDDPKEEIAR